MLIFFIAFSLSMDAFSLAIAYGILNISLKNIITISSLVGIFHFIMPILGCLFGSFILDILPFDINILIFILFLFIGLEMFIETFSDKNYEVITNLYQMLLLSFAVSIDSFGTGIGIDYVTESPIFAYFLFSLFGFSMTYIGFNFGKKIGLEFGKISKILGSFILIIIGIVHLLK